MSVVQAGEQMDPSSQNQSAPPPQTPQPAVAPEQQATAPETLVNTPQTLAPPVTVGGVIPKRPESAGPVQNTSVVKPQSNPNSTQNTLQIAEIRDGLVVMNDGSFRSVVMVKSINFDLMSPQEQEAVESSYQGFLNSLYFPIQIFLKSEKVDLREYIAKMDKIRTEHDNMLLALLMEDYIDFMSRLGEETNIMDKKFYVVIPFFPVIDTTKEAVKQSKNFLQGFGDLFSKKEQHVVINEQDLENAKDELKNRVQSVLGGLQQAGIQGLALDTQELIELYYGTYNPDTAPRQQLRQFDDLTVDIVTKGDGSTVQPHLDRELPQ